MNPIPPHKTPISMLQELCARHDLTPDYKILSVEGVVHAPTFVYRVQVGDNASATAQGHSKKKAKHAAARAILETLLKPGGMFESEETLKELYSLDGWDEPPTVDGGTLPANESPGGGGGKGSCDTSESSGANPVGALQEMCMKRRWRPPHYETIMVKGLPHERTFGLACHVNDYTEVGTGKSKRIAKRQAAQKMIDLLTKDLKPLGEAQDEDKGKYKDLLFRENDLVPGDLKFVPPVSHQNHVSRFIQELRENPGNVLMSLHSMGLGEKGAESIETLEELAYEQRFEFTYIPLNCNEQNKEKDIGTHYCLLQLTNYPVVVCFGSGKTEEDARADAAYSALQYLRVMSKAIPQQHQY